MIQYCGAHIQPGAANTAESDYPWSLNMFVQMPFQLPWEHKAIWR